MGSSDRSAHVSCPACGRVVERRHAREYDRFGDRWSRAGKAFEYLCKPCHNDTCHLPRTGLEATLVTVGDDYATTRDFVVAYYRQLRSEEQMER